MALLSNKLKKQSGQSLIELLIAIAVGAILIGSAVAIIDVTLRVSRENVFIQAASFLNQELADNVAIFAESKWYCIDSTDCGIYNLSKGGSNPYYLDTSTSPFVVVSGNETVPIQVNGNPVNYTRYFYIEDVCRSTIDSDIEGVVPCTGSEIEDPSTQKMVIVTTWSGGGQVQFESYVIRHGNKVLVQTDWSGGATGAGFSVLTSQYHNEFDTESNIDFDGTPGSIQLATP